MPWSCVFLAPTHLCDHFSHGSIQQLPLRAPIYCNNYLLFHLADSAHFIIHAISCFAVFLQHNEKSLISSHNDGVTQKEFLKIISIQYNVFKWTLFLTNWDGIADKRSTCWVKRLNYWKLKNQHHCAFWWPCTVIHVSTFWWMMITKFATFLRSFLCFDRYIMILNGRDYDTEK